MINEMAAVLLGVVDAVLQQSTSWEVSKIGGHPDWMSSAGTVPLCLLCNARTSLIVQVYCPLGESLYHRTLYVFACCHQQCWNKPESWQVLRSQCKAVVAMETSKAKPEVTDSWGVEMDDWGDDDDDDEGASPPKTEETSSEDDVTSDLTSSLAEVTVNDPQCVTAEDVMDPNQSSMAALLTAGKRAESASDGDLYFEAYYVNVIDEPSSQYEEFQHEKELLAKYSAADESAMQLLTKQRCVKSSGEAYEKATAKHGDQLFHKFIKRLGRCPQQILRYSFNGSPLPMTAFDAPSKCKHCSAELVFEMQLLPNLIPCLKSQRNSSVEFGSVMIFSCRQSCWNDSEEMREEQVVIQIDPESILFK